MQREFLALDCVPAEEAGAQVDEPGYKERALRECTVLINQLRRQFGPEPPGASLEVRPLFHEAGSYYAVVVFHELHARSANLIFQALRLFREYSPFVIGGFVFWFSGRFWFFRLCLWNFSDLLIG